MKSYFLVILALAYNLSAAPAHAGVPAAAGSSRDTLDSVKYGRSLCRSIQGYWNQPAGSVGPLSVNTLCDRFVRDHSQLDYVHTALSVCKSPDLDGQSRRDEHIANCFEAAAWMLRHRLVSSEQEIWSAKVLDESEKCQGRIQCLKGVFEDALKADPKLYAVTPASVWGATGRTSAPSNHAQGTAGDATQGAAVIQDELQARLKSTARY